MADKRHHEVIIFTNLSSFPYHIYLFNRNILPLASKSLFIYLFIFVGVCVCVCNKVFIKEYHKEIVCSTWDESCLWPVVKFCLEQNLV